MDRPAGLQLQTPGLKGLFWKSALPSWYVLMGLIFSPLYPFFSVLTTPCCDLCVLKKQAESPDSLTEEELRVLALRDRIMTRKVPQAASQTPEEGDQPGNEIDVDARNGTGEVPRRGDRLEACRNALRNWRIKIWTRDFKRSGLMPEAILPDKILSKLATHARLKTRDLIKEAVPGWILADMYAEDVLKVLEPIDKGWIEDAEQRKEENDSMYSRTSRTR